MIKLKCDHTLRIIDDATLINQNTNLTTYFPQCDNIVTSFPKCDIKGSLCDDNDDTCEIVLETLGMSAIHIHGKNDSLTPRLPLETNQNHIYAMCDACHAKRRHFYFLLNETRIFRQYICDNS